MAVVKQYQGDPLNPFLKKVALAESGNNPNAKNPYGSATGLYQFTDDTWKGVVNKYKLGYSLEDRKNPQKAEKVMRLFTQDNENYIKPILGRELNDADRYMTHFLGAGGASNFFKVMNQNPNAPINTVMSPKALASNKSVVYNKDGSLKTVQDVYGWAGKKMTTDVSQMPENYTEEQKQFDFYTPQTQEVSNLANPELFANFEQKKEEQDILQQKQLEKQLFMQDILKASQVQFIEPEQFQEQPMQEFQSGGTWSKQEVGVKAERDAKLKEVLAREGNIVGQLKKEKGQTKKNRFVRDNTNVAVNNRPELTSPTARNKTDKEIAQEREAKIQESIAYQDVPFTKDNWREVLAKTTQATGDKLRVSDEPNFFDDYLNPVSMIGNMASNLGQAPLQAQQQDSYLPYVTSVGAPLAVGTLAGIGANSTGQFVNNLTNPLAGTGDLVNNLGNRFLPNAYKLNPYAFKASEDMGYRMLGREGYEDAIESQVLRAKPAPNQPTNGGISLSRNTNRNPNTGKMQPALDRPYFADGFIDERYAGDYMAAVNKLENNLVPIPTHKGIAPAQAGSIPLENALLYKKDWLQGYKQVEVPKATQEEFKNGGEKNSLWKNIRENRGSGKKPTKEMLEQERKIKSKEYGGTQNRFIKKYQEGGVIEDDRGQWAHPGEVTKINSGNITMSGVDFPVYGIDNLGNSQMMYPDNDYKFPGTSVTEYPQIKSKNRFLK